MYYWNGIFKHLAIVTGPATASITTSLHISLISRRLSISVKLMYCQQEMNQETIFWQFLQKKKCQDLHVLMASCWDVFQWNEHRWPSVLTVLENNDDCSAIIFAAPLKNSFPYKTAAHSCNSQTFLQ